MTYREFRHALNKFTDIIVDRADQVFPAKPGESGFVIDFEEDFVIFTRTLRSGERSPDSEIRIRAYDLHQLAAKHDTPAQEPVIFLSGTRPI